MVAPKSPSCFICSTISCGYSSAWSNLRATGRSSFSTHVSTASTNACSSRVCSVIARSMAALVVHLVFHAVAAFRDQHGPVERAHLGAVLVGADGAHAHEAGARPRLGVALVEDLGVGVQRVAGEHRVGQPDVGPAEVRDRLLAHVGDAHADDQRDRERAADDALPELARLRVLLVEVQRVGVHRQEREPDVVGLRDRATWAVLVHVADREVLVIAAEGFPVAFFPDLLHGLNHRGSPRQERRASSTMRRALRSTGASTIRPSKRNAPLAASPSGKACSSARAHSTSAGAGANAAWMIGTCRGWIAVLQPKPSASTRRVSSARPSGSARSMCGTSQACSPAARAALTSRPRADARPSQPNCAPSSAARSAPPSISAPSCPPARAICGAFSTPCALSTSAATESNCQPAQAWTHWTSAASSTLGSSSQSRCTPESMSASTSRRPSAVRSPLRRSASPGPPAGLGFAFSQPKTASRAARLRSGCTASSRSMHTRSAPAARALAKRSAFSPETKSSERGWRAGGLDTIAVGYLYGQLLANRLTAVKPPAYPPKRWLHATPTIA